MIKTLREIAIYGAGVLTGAVLAVVAYSYWVALMRGAQGLLP